MRKPFFLLLPSSLFQKGITADEAEVYSIWSDHVDVRKAGKQKGWGGKWKGRKVGTYNGASIKANRKTPYRKLFLQQVGTNLNQVF